MFGRKIYSTASFQLWVATHQALLGGYDYNTWQSMAKFLDSLPEGSKQEFLAILKEGKTLARAALQAASDAAVSAIRTMGLVMSMRRASWQQGSRLPVRVQQSIKHCSRTKQTTDCMVQKIPRLLCASWVFTCLCLQESGSNRSRPRVSGAGPGWSATIRRARAISATRANR